MPNVYSNTYPGLARSLIPKIPFQIRKCLDREGHDVFSNPKFPSFAKVFPQAPVGNFFTLFRLPHERLLHAVALSVEDQ